jgi:hypothetical protein
MTVELVTSFRISIPDTALADLQARLALTRLPDELNDAGWHYGVPLADIKRLLTHWRNGYDWRKHEEAMNKLPHFTIDIDVTGFGALNIHFIHQRSAVEGAIPLLFVHGCEFSFISSCSNLHFRRNQGREVSWKLKKSFLY